MPRGFIKPRRQKKVKKRKERIELRELEKQMRKAGKVPVSRKLLRVRKPKIVDKYDKEGKFTNLRQRGYDKVPTGALVASSMGFVPTAKMKATAAALTVGLGLDQPLPDYQIKPRKEVKKKNKPTARSKLLAKNKPQECPVARAILNASSSDVTPISQPPEVNILYSEVTSTPTPKERKELILARDLLQQFCSQMGVTYTAKAVDSGERNKFNLPVHVATAEVTIEGRHYQEIVPALSPNIAVQLAQQGLLFKLFPQCETLLGVQQQLKSNKKTKKKEKQARSKQRKEQFLIGLFPGCTSIEEARERMTAGWPSRKERRRKRPHEEIETLGPFQILEESSERPAKKQRMAMDLL